MLNLVFLGVQGCGKGTQANILKERFNYEHISTGEMLREHIKNKTAIGLKAEAYLSKGALIPDEDVFELLFNHISEGKSGIVFDGFPRTLVQAQYLEEKIKIDYAIFFELSDEAAIERIVSRRVCQQCQTTYNMLLKPPKNSNQCDVCGGHLESRDDDYEEAIRSRINSFHKQTKPLIEFYKSMDKVIFIDAADSPEKIHKNLSQRINL